MLQTILTVFYDGKQKIKTWEHDNIIETNLDFKLPKVMQDQ